MAQMRGTGSYGIGVQNAFGAPSQDSPSDSKSPLDAIREHTSKIEDMLDTISEPIKPYVKSTNLPIEGGGEGEGENTPSHLVQPLSVVSPECERKKRKRERLPGMEQKH